MPKYLDQTGLARYHGNVEKRPVQTFDTVAAMQACTWLKAGMTCHTNGFHASGDGGAAYYTVSASGTANGMDVLALQGGLKAALVHGDCVKLEQLGFTTNHESASIFIYAVANFKEIVCDCDCHITETMRISANNKTVIFNGFVTAAGAQNSFEIDGSRNRLNVYRYTNTTQGAVFCKIGGSSLCQTNIVDVFYCDVPNGTAFILGGNLGVLDSVISGNSISYGVNAFRFDLSNAYVGQIVINNFRISTLVTTEQYAFDIDCANNGMTGLILNSISMEGARGGIHAYNTTAQRRFETLHANSIRLAEFATSGYCFLKLEGSGQLNGDCTTDIVYANTFDFSNSKPSIPNSFYATFGNGVFGDCRANKLYASQGGFEYVPRNERNAYRSNATITDYFPSNNMLVSNGAALTINLTTYNVPHDYILFTISGEGYVTFKYNGSYKMGFHHDAGQETGSTTYMIKFVRVANELQLVSVKLGTNAVYGFAAF